MAYAMTKQGSLDNCITYEFICDTLEDMNAIENRYRTIGSVAVVLQGESGGMEAYIAGSNKQWNNLGAMGANGSSSESTGSGLSIYICAQNEVSNGLPNIQDPDETTIYLVSAGNESGNLYEEYIYINNTWEKFGAGSIDLSSYATKANPEFTGTIKINGGVTPGTNAIALGYGSVAQAQNSIAILGGNVAQAATGAIAIQNATAAGANALAIGGGCTAEGNFSFAHGTGNYTKGQGSHAEGQSTSARGTGSHSEGSSTEANGNFSHTEGASTRAAGTYSHVSGMYNVEDSYNNLDEWVANTSYTVGDKVRVTTISNNTQTVQGYICKTANNDSAFTASKWTSLYGRMNYAEIVGNGDTNNSRSNARALDWDGNEYLNGDLYVGCNANSTGGTKLPRIPEVSSTDGTYILQATVTNGTPTYSWVSLSSLSGVTF